MNTVQRLCLALALVVSSAACAGNQASAKHSPMPATTVEVTNNNWSDMVVYAVRGGTRYRLGTVTSMRTANFPLPKTLNSYAGRMELVADPIGSTETFSTGRITFAPGQKIEFEIENHLAISNYSVWGQ